MKTEIVFIQSLKSEIVFYIGTSKNDNFKVIDAGNSNDLWFHSKNDSSCHVVCKITEDLNKKDLIHIIKMGAFLCKKNTNKLKNIQNVEFIYTQIKNITKTKNEGCVLTTNTKTIVC